MLKFLWSAFGLSDLVAAVFYVEVIAEAEFSNQEDEAKVWSPVL